MKSESTGSRESGSVKVLEGVWCFWCNANEEIAVYSTRCEARKRLQEPTMAFEGRKKVADSS